MTAGVGRHGPGNASDFYPTPPAAAWALRRWWGQHNPEGPARVIDPCAGMGCLLIPWTVPRAGEDAAELLGLEGEAALVASSRRGWVEADRPASPVRQGDGLAWLASSEDRAGHGRAELVIANPPFSRADEWVKAVVAWVKATGSPAAVLLRSQWIDDGNTKGRGEYRHGSAPWAILRLPWRIRFNGAGADSCTYAWHIWDPCFASWAGGEDWGPGVATFWAPFNGPEAPPAWGRLWERAAAVSRGD